MTKTWLGLILLTGAFTASAQSIIYNPTQTIDSQKISLKPWGSGTIAQTDETAYHGSDSVRISTNNLFQGGILNFGSPIDLTKDFAVKDDLLQLTFLAPDSSMVFGGNTGGKAGAGQTPGVGGMGSLGGSKGGSGKGGPMGAGNGMQGLKGSGQGAKGGGNIPGAGAGMQGGPSTPGAGGAPGATDTTPKVLTMIRLVITTTDGMKSEVYLPADTVVGSDTWKQIAVPVSNITGFDRTNKMIQSIAVSGDMPATIYVGDLRVVNDATPITGSINQTATNLALGDQLTLSGSGYGGATILEYDWNFGDGTQVDSVGQTVRHTFRTPGHFKVSLTIVDKYGAKAPYTTTVDITVNG